MVYRLASYAFVRVVFVPVALAVLVAAPLPALAQSGGGAVVTTGGSAGRIGDTTIAPRIGWVYYADGENYGDSLGGASVTGLSGHAGMNLQVNFDFGGAGGSFEFAPFYTYHATSGDPMHTIGLYFGWAYRFEVLDGTLYPSIGIGARWGYLSAPGSDFGFETTLRFPIAATYYITEDIGLLFEVGLGYSNLIITNSDSLFTLSGFYTDGGVGIRWP